MNDILTFKKMITPVIIQIIFLIGCLGAVGYGIGMIGSSVLFGLFSMAGGILVVRVYCELMILLFRINDNLEAIREKAN